MSMLDSISLKPSGWLSATGPQADKVLSSRVRLARNVQTLHFPQHANADELRHVADTIHRALPALDELKPAEFVELGALSELDREVLNERHIIERNSVGEPSEAAAIFRDDELMSVQINKEDHLRICGFASGLDLWEALRLAREVDRELEGFYEPAYDERLGYLTACPTNVGTGMRASVLVHLPGLVLTREISKVINGISQIGLVVRGFRGEGSGVVGNLFQVSNQTTLGPSEEEIVEMMDRIVAQLLQYEVQAQEVLAQDARLEVEDKVWRAFGLLRSSRLLGSKECAALCSAVRFGVDLGMVEGVDISFLNEMIELCRPAHIQKRVGGDLSAEERDYRRSEYVRSRLLPA